MSKQIPQRVLFTAQTIATILGALISVGVTDWVIVNVKDLCQQDQVNRFVCPGSNTFFSAAVIWGARKTVITSRNETRLLITTQSVRSESMEMVASTTSSR